MRISVTDVESFRRYRTDEDFPLAVLLSQLRREEPPSVNMLAGTAFHHLLEEFPIAGVTINRSTIDGFAFDLTHLHAELTLAPIREVRGTRDYEIDGDVYTLSGRVDGLHGLAVDDHKLTKQFDAVKYADSIQWRCYLAIFGGRTFNYNVFVARIDDEQDENRNVPVEIREFHKLSLYAYPELEADVEREVRRYVGFAKRHLWTKVVTHFRQEATV